MKCVKYAHFGCWSLPLHSAAILRPECPYTVAVWVGHTQGLISPCMQLPRVLHCVSSAFQSACTASVPLHHWCAYLSSCCNDEGSVDSRGIFFYLTWLRRCEQCSIRSFFCLLISSVALDTALHDSALICTSSGNKNALVLADLKGKVREKLKNWWCVKKKSSEWRWLRINSGWSNHNHFVVNW